MTGIELQVVAEGTRRELGKAIMNVNSDVSLGLRRLHYNSCSIK